MDTSSDINELIAKKSDKKEAQATDEAVKKTRPLIPKSSICRLLAELVRSYPGCAKLISEYSYRECQSELITEVILHIISFEVIFEFSFTNLMVVAGMYCTIIYS